jgi:hypothetical protein
MGSSTLRDPAVAVHYSGESAGVRRSRSVKRVDRLCVRTVFDGAASDQQANAA